MWRVVASLLICAAANTACVLAAEPVSKEDRASIIDAVGGEAKLLKLFRMKERLAVSGDPAAKGNERTSICEPPGHWWLGKNDRVVKDKEPATFLVWAWTLGILTDPKSKIERLPDPESKDARVFGLRVSESVTPHMDLYFDRESRRLSHIEWRADRHVFSDWKEVDGVAYPSKCIGYKLKDNKHWYHTEILELERLTELPAGLTRE